MRADPAAPRDALAPGAYRIVREIGRGGMGVVHEAVDEQLGRRVALKVLAPSTAGGPEDLRRFLREARAAARLHHTNIVPVFGLVEHEGASAIVMQLIDGHSLDAMIRDERLGFGGAPGRDDTTEAESPTVRLDALPLGGDPSASHASAAHRARRYRQAATLGLQVAEALAHAHSQGVFHRDVKPSNVLVDPTGTAWVTDFGLAHVAGDDGLTRTGDIVGTVRYMAPERLSGRSDARTDVHGVGLMLHEIVALAPARTSADRAQLLQEIATSTPRSLGEIDPLVPRDLETIVTKACQHDPAARYASARDLADDLRRFLDGRPIRARRVSAREALWRWCRRNPVVVGLLAAVVLLLSALAASSLVASARLRGALDRSIAAEREGRRSLHDALLAQARAERVSGEAGQRTEALRALAGAAAIARELDLGDAVTDVLRDEAIAALANVDVEEVSRLHWDECGFLALVDPAGPILAACEGGGDLVVRSFPDGKELTRWPDAIGRDAISIVSPRPDATVRLVGAATSGRLRLLVGDPPVPRTIDGPAELGLAVVGRGGGALHVISATGGLQAIDAATGAVLHAVPDAPWRDTTALVPSPDGTSLAWLGGLPPRLEVRDAASGRLLVSGAVSTDATKLARGALRWSADGRRLLVAHSMTVRLVDATSLETVGTFSGHQDVVVVIALDPTGRFVASSGHDGRVRVFGPGGGVPLVTLPGHVLLGFDAEGRLLTNDRERRDVVAWALPAASERRVLEAGPLARPHGFTSDGTHLVVSAGGASQLWSVEAATLAHVVGLDVHDGSFDPAHGEMLVASPGGFTRLPIAVDASGRLAWGAPTRVQVGGDVQTWLAFPAGEQAKRLLSIYPESLASCALDGSDFRFLSGKHGRIWSAALSPDGRRAVTGAWNGFGVRAWSLDDDAPPRELPGTSEERRARVAFTPDGIWLVAALIDRYQLFRVADWSPGPSFARTRAPAVPGPLSLTRDGRLLAGSRGQSDATIWRIPELTVVATFPVERGTLLTGAAIGPDGGSLAVSTALGRVDLWDLEAVNAQLERIGVAW